MTRNVAKRLLRKTLSKLQFEAARLRSTRPGAMVMNPVEIHGHFISFKYAWNSANIPSLHFVKIDVSASFDTVPQKAVVCDIVPEILTQDRYVIVHFAVRYASLRFEVAPSGMKRKFYVCSEAGEESYLLRLYAQNCAGNTQVLY